MERHLQGIALAGLKSLEARATWAYKVAAVFCAALQQRLLLSRIWAQNVLGRGVLHVIGLVVRPVCTVQQEVYAVALEYVRGFHILTVPETLIAGLQKIYCISDPLDALFRTWSWISDVSGFSCSSRCAHPNEQLL